VPPGRVRSAREPRPRSIERPGRVRRISSRRPSSRGRLPCRIPPPGLYSGRQSPEESTLSQAAGSRQRAPNIGIPKSRGSSQERCAPHDPRRTPSTRPGGSLPRRGRVARSRGAGSGNLLACDDPRQFDVHLLLLIGTSRIGDARAAASDRAVVPSARIRRPRTARASGHYDNSRAVRTNSLGVPRVSPCVFPS
jgi:hypothetical protein